VESIELFGSQRNNVGMVHVASIDENFFTEKYFCKSSEAKIEIDGAEFVNFTVFHEVHIPRELFVSESGSLRLRMTPPLGKDWTNKVAPGWDENWDGNYSDLRTWFNLYTFNYVDVYYKVEGDTVAILQKEMYYRKGYDTELAKLKKRFGIHYYT